MAFFDKSGEIHLKDDLANDFKIYTEPGLVTTYIVFNMKDTIAQNKNLRKAIAHAIDFKKKIELLSNGRGLTLGSIVPLSIGGSEKDIGNYGIPFDLEKARDYMKKAGYGDKTLQLVMTIGGTTTMYQNLYEFLRDSLDKIGIDLKPDYKTWPSYLKSTQIGDFQMATAAWAADYPDPENFYQLLFSENTRGSAFKNDEYDKLYDEMRFMQNSPERFEIIKKMAQILQEEVPVIFDSTPLVSGLVQNWLTNFKRNIMVDYPFKYLNVNQKSEKTVAQK
jgi:ABC-type transport system substrate-binding protein